MRGKRNFQKSESAWASQTGPGWPGLHLRSCTAEAGGPEGYHCSLWVPSIDEWEGQHIRMTGIFHSVLLWPHVLSCSLWYITFPNMVSIRMGRERICWNVYLSTAREFRTLWTERLTPQNENREQETRWDSVTGLRNVAPPRVISPRSFSARSSQLNYPMEALVCCVPSLYGFCNKKC